MMKLMWKRTVRKYLQSQYLWILILHLEYSIHDWPVSMRNQSDLDTIKSTHSVRQIPAYDVRENSINPIEYEEKLAGAICRVCFVLTHYLIKPRHFFNAVVRDITVLRPPSKVTPTSLKSILHPSKKRKIT